VFLNFLQDDNSKILYFDLFHPYIIVYFEGFFKCFCKNSLNYLFCDLFFFFRHSAIFRKLFPFLT